MIRVITGPPPNTVFSGGVGRGVVTYAVRPRLMQGCVEVDACSLLGTQGPLHLAGYGVELAIKNMEYSALDDSQVSSILCLSSPPTSTSAGRTSVGRRRLQPPPPPSLWGLFWVLAGW